MNKSIPPHSDRRPVAYLNEKFLNSPDARAIRILSEFLEPLAHFRREKVRDTVVFFGSARIREGEGPLARYYDEARTLARMLTEWADAVHQQHAPVRGLLGRRAGHHGGGQPRRGRRRGQDRRAEHRAAVRAVSQPLHHAGTELRIPLLLHAQVLVRVPGQGAGGVSRRLRHAGRDDGTADAHADAETGQEDHDRAVRHRVLEGDSSISTRWSATG